MVRRYPAIRPSRARRRATALIGSAVIGVVAPEVRAQDSTQAVTTCSGEQVTAIDIRPEPPRIVGRNAPWWRKLLFSVLLQHRTTRPDVVRDYLRVKEGEPCREVERAETERILRAQPFIADATVRLEPDSTAGGSRLVVETVDEVPTIIGARISDGSLSGFKFGNANVMGRGRYMSAQWVDGFAHRDGVALKYSDYHVLDGPNTFSVSLDRAPLYGDYSVALARPFLTQLQSAAWHAGYRNASRYTRFLRPDTTAVSLRVRRQLFDLGGVYRVGNERSRVFVGALLTYERVDPDDEGKIISDAGITSDPDTAFRNRYDSFDETRGAFVVGVSSLRYLKVVGFDALEGVQDLGEGVQVAAVVDPGFVGSGGRFYSADVYGGTGSQNWFAGARVEGEFRDPEDARSWSDAVLSGRAAWYIKPVERQVLVTEAEYTGAWRHRIPYELTLAARRGGQRGYKRSDVAGARRLIVRGEHRTSLGGMSRFTGFGVAGFTELGKTWAGEVPYGQDSDLKVSVGAGLLVAVPKQSRRLLRFDFAFPVTSEGREKWEFRFTVTKATSTFWREPGDIAQVRAGTPASNIFSWP